jgi:hypothetical protein
VSVQTQAISIRVDLTIPVTIFTPDTTHYPIALYAIERGIHVLVTKPAVKLLEHHQYGYFSYKMLVTTVWRFAELAKSILPHTL